MATNIKDSTFDYKTLYYVEHSDRIVKGWVDKHIMDKLDADDVPHSVIAVYRPLPEPGKERESASHINVVDWFQREIRRARERLYDLQVRAHFFDEDLFSRPENE